MKVTQFGGKMAESSGDSEREGKTIRVGILTGASSCVVLNSGSLRSVTDVAINF